MVSESVSGTTTNEYVESVVSEMSHKEWFHGVVKNTGDTNAMKYKVVGKLSATGTATVDIVTETEIVAGATAEIKVGPAKWFEITTTVKSSVAGSHTTFVAEWIDG